VRVSIRLFAALRERAGVREQDLELPEGATVASVWPALSASLDLGDEPSGLVYAVNREYAARGVVLAAGDEVALIPPVSGGAFVLSEEALSLDAAVREVARDGAGAIASFVGTTRSHSRGRTVIRLEYEAYAGMAEKTMAEIAESLRSRYDLLDVAIHHRVGVVAVSAAHRADALAACRDAIDTLKETVPLWKKEIYEGGEEWIGRGS
jgi:molybdopterin synthase catalytic subunit